MLASRFFMKRKNNTILRASAPTTLLALMQAKLGGMTVTSIKQLLRARRVQLNGAICTRADQAVQAGDEVTILSQAGSTTLHHPKLALIYEDDYLIVVNKKQGLLTVPSNPDSADTIPIPPIQWVRQRSILIERGRFSTSLRIVAPVVVKPLTLSKRASA